MEYKIKDKIIKINKYKIINAVDVKNIIQVFINYPENSEIIELINGCFKVKTFKDTFQTIVKLDNNDCKKISSICRTNTKFSEEVILVLKNQIKDYDKSKKIIQSEDLKRMEFCKKNQKQLKELINEYKKSNFKITKFCELYNKHENKLNKELSEKLTPQLLLGYIYAYEGKVPGKGCKKQTTYRHFYDKAYVNLLEKLVRNYYTSGLTRREYCESIKQDKKLKILCLDFSTNGINTKFNPIVLEKQLETYKLFNPEKSRYLIDIKNAQEIKKTDEKRLQQTKKFDTEEVKKTKLCIDGKYIDRKTIDKNRVIQKEEKIWKPLLVGLTINNKIKTTTRLGKSEHENKANTLKVWEKINRWTKNQKNINQKQVNHEYSISTK